MSNTCFHFEPFSMKRKHKRWANTKGEQAAEQSSNPKRVPLVHVTSFFHWADWMDTSRRWAGNHGAYKGWTGHSILRLNQPKHGDVSNQRLEFKQPNWGSHKKNVIQSGNFSLTHPFPIIFPIFVASTMFEQTTSFLGNFPGIRARRRWHGELPVLPTQLRWRSPLV